MPFNFDAPKTFFKKCARAVDWIVEEIIRQKDWRSLISLINSSSLAASLLALDFVLFIAFSPVKSPFPSMLSLFPQLKQFGWYPPVFWSLIVLIFIIAVIVVAPAESETTEHKPDAIKGLAPFGYEDAEIFSRLRREENLKECLQAIGDEQWRFGALSGEPGVGKTSFLQAGLWPEMEKRGFRCVYVKFSDLDPFESVKRACLKHLSFADGAPGGADFLGLLRAAAAQDRTPVVLFFDQFEQFFVHRERKKDREPFAQALTRWFAETPSPPIKILICIRGDFFDRLNELQRAMRYSLGPTQSFRLERFEPDQAAEIFCFLAEKEGLEYDREFISEMTRQELADAEDGLVSPLDIQALARMIEMRTAQEGRAFDRATVQKLGGLEGLLEQYLTNALEPLITRSSRQAAVDVLLALADLKRDVRAGALTFEDLRQKLGGGLAGSRLKDTVAFLLRDDARLISPSSENEEEKFELAHERLIPALRRLAGKQLSEADRASQLLDRRTNKWLGNGRDWRYRLTWLEFWLINKHRRFAVRGKERRAKEELLAAGRRSFIWLYALVGLVILLIFFGRIHWHSNAWQTYLIKKYLYSQAFRLNDKEASIEIATTLAHAGESQLALRVLDRIGNDYSKADALGRVARSLVEIEDKEKSGALLSDMIKMVERMHDDGGKVRAMELITGSYFKLGDNGKVGALLSEQVKVVERFSDGQHKAAVLSRIARSYAELGEAMKADALLKEAIKVLGRTSDDHPKAYTLGAIADSYFEIVKTVKDDALLKEAIKIAGQIRDSQSKADARSKIVEFYVRLGVMTKDGAPMKEAIKAAEQIGDGPSKAKALGAIARSYTVLGDKEKARVLREGAIRTAERISSSQDKALALKEISISWAELGEGMKDGALLEEAVKIAERIRIDDGYSKSDALSEVAWSYARLGEMMKDGAMLKEAIKILERIGANRFRGYDFREIIRSYARLGDKERARALLEDAIKMAERIDVQNNANTLNAIVQSYAELGEEMKDGALLKEAIKIADRISNDISKSDALSGIARSYARLGEAMKDGALLEEAIKIAERISKYTSKSDPLNSTARFYADALNAIARSYAEIGETKKAGALLEEVIKIANRIGDDYTHYKSYTLSETAESYAKLGDKKKARALLEDAVKAAKWIDGFNKASVLSAIVRSYAKVAESSNDPALLYDISHWLISWPLTDSDRDRLFDAILSSKLAIADVGRLRLLTSYYDSELGRTRALARILMACSRPDLIGKERNAETDVQLYAPGSRRRTRTFDYPLRR